MEGVDVGIKNQDVGANIQMVDRWKRGLPAEIREQLMSKCRAEVEGGLTALTETPELVPTISVVKRPVMEVEMTGMGPLTRPALITGRAEQIARAVFGNALAGHPPTDEELIGYCESRRRVHEQGDEEQYAEKQWNLAKNTVAGKENDPGVFKRVFGEEAVNFLMDREGFKAVGDETKARQMEDTARMVMKMSSTLEKRFSQ